MKAVLQMLSTYEENTKWLNQHYDELKQKYDDEWVAVVNKSVIDHDRDLNRLVDRLRKGYSETYSQIAVEYVTKREIDLILFM